MKENRSVRLKADMAPEESLFAAIQTIVTGVQNGTLNRNLVRNMLEPVLMELYAEAVGAARSGDRGDRGGVRGLPREVSPLPERRPAALLLRQVPRPGLPREARGEAPVVRQTASGPLWIRRKPHKKTGSQCRRQGRRCVEVIFP